MDERDQFYQDAIAKGASEEQKQEVLDERKQLFEEEAVLMSREREKTPEEIAVINVVRSHGDRLSEALGLPKFDVSPDHFHIIPADQWPEDMAEPGLFDDHVQQIALKEQSSSLVLAAKAYHEYTHLKSCGVLQVVDLPEGHRLSTGETSYSTHYRVGFTVTSRDGSKEYFRLINEAITEELTRSFIAHASANESVFQNEVAATQQLAKQYVDRTAPNGKPFVNDEVYLVEEKGDYVKAVSFVYQTERAALNNIVNKLYERNQADLASSEEVYWMFVRGAMNGDILPIGRLIDKTFGSGTFRRIGEITDPDELLAYVGEI